MGEPLSGSVSGEAEDRDRGIPTADFGGDQVVYPYDARDDRHVLRIVTNPIIKAHLEQLVKTGRYGKGYTEAAERIIAQEIGRLVDQGKLKDPEK